MTIIMIIVRIRVFNELLQNADVIFCEIDFWNHLIFVITKKSLTNFCYNTHTHTKNNVFYILFSLKYFTRIEILI